VNEKEKMERERESACERERNIARMEEKETLQRERENQREKR